MAHYYLSGASYPNQATQAVCWRRATWSAQLPTKTILITSSKPSSAIGALEIDNLTTAEGATRDRIDIIQDIVSNYHRRIPQRKARLRSFPTRCEVFR